MLNRQLYPDDRSKKEHFILGVNSLTILITEAHFWVVDNVPEGAKKPGIWAEAWDQVSEPVCAGRATAGTHQVIKVTRKHA